MSAVLLGKGVAGHPCAYRTRNISYPEGGHHVDHSQVGQEYGEALNLIGEGFYVSEGVELAFENRVRGVSSE